MATLVQSRQIVFLCGSNLFPLYCMNANMLDEHCSISIADAESSSVLSAGDALQQESPFL